MTIYPNGVSPLEVDRIVRDEDGNVIQARVLNGDWLYRRTNTHHLACRLEAPNDIVTSWPITAPTVERIS